MRLASACAVALLFAACTPDHFDPVAWNPPPSDGSNEAKELNFVSFVQMLDGHGPETVIAGPDGWLFTGVKDGRILRFRPDGSAAEEFANTGGRANGLAFDHDENLIVADSYKGLLSIDPDGSVEVLATAANGQDFMFPDGLDIASDGTIWFTDATSRYPDGQFHYDVLEGQKTGRLLSYDPTSRDIRVRAQGLRFPNGIALGPGDEYILVNETLGYRTLRHWIEGPRAGTTVPFVEGYPGMPDDIRYNDDGLFWIALVSERLSLVDWVQPHPWLKFLIAHAIGWAVPDSDSPLLQSPAFVVAIDTDGNVVHRLRAESQHFVGSTSVLEFDGQLFVGSISMNAVGVVAPESAGLAKSRHVGRRVASERSTTE